MKFPSYHTAALALGLVIASTAPAGAGDINDVYVFRSPTSLTVDVEVGKLPGTRDTLAMTLYGSKTADPRTLVATGDGSAIFGDFNRDGFQDVAFVRGNWDVDDLDGDGTPDLVTAPGTEGGPHVFVLDAHPGFMGGVRVAVGDVNGDGTADIVVDSTGRTEKSDFAGGWGSSMYQYAFPGTY